MSPFSRDGWRRLGVLVRREVWEHRSLVWLPMVAILLHLLFALALVLVPRNGVSFQMEMRQEQQGVADSLGGLTDSRMESTRLNWDMSTASLLDLAASTPPAERGRLLDRLALGHAHLLFVLGSCLVVILFSRMVNREKMNRSSLFFLSMPLSPWMYLGGKLATTVLALALAWVTVVLSQLLGLMVFSAAALAHGHSAVELLWGSAHLLRLWALLGTQLVVDTLWALPLFGLIALMASLGWSGKSNRFGALWVVLVFVIAVDRSHGSGGLVWHWIWRHLSPMAFNWEARAMDALRIIQGQTPVPDLGLDLLLGVLLGLLLLVAAAKALHWREET